MILQCSGATSLVKGLLVLEKEKVPKHIGIKTKLNTKLPDLTGVHIPLNGAILPRGNGRENRRSIMVNNFSAAGGNTSLIVRDGPHFVQAVTVSSPHSEHLFVLSAQTQQSLAATADRLLAFLDANPGVSIADLCYTLSAKRVHHALRLAGSVRSADDVRKLLCGKSKEATSVSQPPKVGIVFSGQGAQYVDMGRALYESSRAFRRSIQRCNWIARSAGFPDFVAALYPPAGSDKTEPSPIEFQLSMVAVEVALMSLLQSWGVQPSIVAGHSLGEYTALWSAGVLSLRDLIVLVGSRATLMVEHCTPNASTMIAVKASPSDVENLLATNKIEGCEIACYNSPTDLVVAGPIASVHALKAAADNAVPKVKSMVLPVPYAFHSRAVEPLMDAFAPVANKARFNKPRVPVISNVLGRPVVDMGTFTGDYLVKHMRQPVKFAEGIAELTASGTQPADYWIEVGPHPTTLPMLKGCFAGHSAFAEPKMTASLKKGLDARSSVLGFVQDLYFQGVPVNFAQVHESLGTTGTLLRLPNYAFDVSICLWTL